MKYLGAVIDIKLSFKQYTEQAKGNARNQEKIQKKISKKTLVSVQLSTLTI